MTNLAHGTAHEMNAKELAKREKVSVRAIGIPYAKLRREGHPLFASQFDCNAPLSQDQIDILRPGKLTTKKVKISKSVAHADNDSIVEPGPVIVPAPQKKKTDVLGISALAVAFIIPTLASAFNTYDVSHQVAKDWRVAMFIMVMVMFTPALFIAARMNWIGAFVGFGIVIFEAFCNLSAIYLSLMGKMEYILDGKRGVCSDFLQSVVDLTNSDHRPTAVLIGGALAALIALTQLTAFWAIRNRLK